MLPNWAHVPIAATSASWPGNSMLIMLTAWTSLATHKHSRGDADADADADAATDADADETFL